jgi:hypothetical protein
VKFVVVGIVPPYSVLINVAKAAILFANHDHTEVWRREFVFHGHHMLFGRAAHEGCIESLPGPMQTKPAGRSCFDSRRCHAPDSGAGAWCEGRCQRHVLTGCERARSRWARSFKKTSEVRGLVFIVCACERKSALWQERGLGPGILLRDRETGRPTEEENPPPDDCSKIDSPRHSSLR